jgi:hypothetical protein
VDISPARLPAWLNGFAVRHGGYRVTHVDEAVRLVSGDGTTVGLFAPPGAATPGEAGDEDIEAFVVESLRERRIGLLLARQASVAVGIAEGPRLVSSKVDTFYVQSRTAAGGWSQQRYARRRFNQAKAAAEGAAEVAVRVLIPALDSLAALVTGGDRRTVETIMSEPAMAPAVPLRSARFLAVGPPRRATLDEALELARAVRILVRDPPSPADRLRDRGLRPSP